VTFVTAATHFGMVRKKRIRVATAAAKLLLLQLYATLGGVLRHHTCLIAFKHTMFAACIAGIWMHAPYILAPRCVESTAWHLRIVYGSHSQQLVSAVSSLPRIA
jgi:hypothetical protein